MGTSPVLQPLLTPTFGATASAAPNELHSSPTGFEESFGASEATPALAIAAPPAMPGAEKTSRLVPQAATTNAPERETPAQELHLSQHFSSPPLIHTPHTVTLPSERIVPEERHATPARDIRREAEGVPVSQPRPAFPLVAATEKATPSSQQIFERRQEVFNRSTPPKADTGREQQERPFTSGQLLAQKAFSEAETLRPIAPLRASNDAMPEVARAPRHVLLGAIRPAVAPELKTISDKRADHHLAPPKASTAAPTIRVNIGRIEVRAVHPPAAPVAPLRRERVRSGPLLSLEDYLRQRNGRSQ